MVNDEMNLMGREEKVGRLYPSIVEKIGMLLSISCCIIVGRWLWLSSNLPSAVLWFTSICILPIIALVIAELIGRFYQKLHSKNH